MSTNVVERLHDDFHDLRDFLMDPKADKKGLALLSVVDENFPKTLLLAVASHFEHLMKTAVEEFVRDVTDDDYRLVSLINGKVIERQYHTWFDWKANNANRFFGMFGDLFKKHAEKTVKEDDRLDAAIRAFLEIGNARNKLIHEDFAAFELNKTSAEIYQLYERASFFVEWFPSAIREFPTPMDPWKG